MRSIITSALLGLGALGLTAASPAQAQASWLSEFLHSRVDPGYYDTPYVPGTSAVPYDYGYVPNDPAPYYVPYGAYRSYRPWHGYYGGYWHRHERHGHDGRHGHHRHHH